ncbi:MULTISPECIES: AbrB/MazE/SpoVT family DNA-binding domain-containing protein [Thermococcus]|uniref:AbrB/MazE/SpoVT family DNA-binding domain-containing protein n=1 Tax=Thermococcus waiotapuensis TaxID=90909 RepID=A0AAE4NWD3_9EURY|nr:MULTISPECIES: AbrB/MazE/SpoVT family DNA-binding domain-containing protein [Thermococcus]MDV3103922.1 AbrB/MazE/SpoVT family DNA-binding domain-containing protein [Thermococcus waiotapuensis]
MGKVGLTKVDEKGRIVIPKEIRRKLKIKPGEEFVVTELDGDTLIVKRFNVKKMLEGLIEKAKDVDLEKLQMETAEEGNRVARKKYREVFD